MKNFDVTIKEEGKLIKLYMWRETLSLFRLQDKIFYSEAKAQCCRIIFIITQLKNAGEQRCIGKAEQGSVGLTKPLYFYVVHQH